ncbi:MULTISPECIES: HAD family hydrolase [Rhodopseudomonas]|uniref:HAD-superfamily hydrolase, subfamily IA, variant 3 n=1 Tax=Rhodopseudomonas palustris (strain DX-1) TaxID=652103 RepID=E6VG91_RHOPX|nr:HAD family hydrolase [Rhodopseudomonas palustris]NEW88291.1 HAD family hydrolase [Rhodopseudomonas sp. WA056]QDL99806.1 HAD family hydrolase [Rhodopseudomonas palustris]
MTPDLVIFDCDGVLVDSELISCRVHAETLTRYGYPITPDQVAARFLGRSGREARREIEAELGRPFADDLETHLLDELLRAFAETLQPIPFVSAALDALGRPFCVASSGTLDRIRVALTHAGLHARFAPHLFSAEQVARGKPAPDLFLFAAARMGAPPERCVVIEDSVPGVLGAKAAGMTVLGFHGGSHCVGATAAALRAAGADRCFADMRQLPRIIEEI